MYGDIFGCHYWEREGLVKASSGWGPRMGINILLYTPTAKNYLTQNVNGAEVEKPWNRRSLTSLHALKITEDFWKDNCLDRIPTTHWKPWRRMDHSTRVLCLFQSPGEAWDACLLTGEGFHLCRLRVEPRNLHLSKGLR